MQATPIMLIELSRKLSTLCASCTTEPELLHAPLSAAFRTPCTTPSLNQCIHQAMQFLSRCRGYHPLQADEEGQKSDGEVQHSPEESTCDPTLISSLKCLLTLLLVAVLATLYFHDLPAQHRDAAATFCEKPDVRREWRSLTTGQREEYLSAVTCLATKRSHLGLNQTLHDDFAYVHIWFGHDSHDGASFFAYHRWFLHLYETALRDECQYSGSMTLVLPSLCIGAVAD